MRTFSLIPCLALGFAALASAGSLGLKNAKVAISSPDGLHDATYSLKEPEPLLSPVELFEQTTFKLTFTTVDTSSGEGVFPQQAHLLFEDPQGDSVTLPVSVKSNGRASFTINTAKAPAALLSTHGTFHLTLLLSSLNTHTPLQYPLGTLSLPSSILTSLPKGRHDLPPRQGEPAFQAEQELFHTFREDEKTVGWAKSVIGTALSLSPWVVLFGLVGGMSNSLRWQTPPTTTYLFLGCLTALEGLIFVYWLGLKIYQFLPSFLVLALVSAYTGKVALGGLREKRLKAGGVP